MSEVTGESGFEIDGERYPIPTLDTITLDEERVLFIYADTVVSDFVPAHPDWDAETTRAHWEEQAAKLRNPNFKRALVHIAYRRRHADMSDSDINDLIGTANALDLDLELLRGAVDEDPPKVSPNALDETNEKSPLERNTGFGRRIETPSETPEDLPADIGISASDTSSPESLPIESAS